MSATNTKKARKTCGRLSLETLETRWAPAGLAPGTSDNVVTGLFLQLRHSEPTPAQRAVFSNQLQAGVPVVKVVNQLWDSPGFRKQEVTGYYQTFLNRTPSVTETNGWVNTLQQQTPEESVIRGFLTSREFSARFPTPGDYATAVYRTLLRRDPSSLELNRMTTALAAGGSRARLASEVLGSREFHTIRVQSLYTAVLGRTAKPAELSAQVAAWSRVGASIRSIETNFLASAENVRNLADRQFPLASPLVTEYPLTYSYGNPSTHEIVEDPLQPGIFWISGQLHDALVKFDSATGQRTTYQLVSGAMPHGIAFNATGHMFVSMEGLSQVGEFDRTTGVILPSSVVDVSLNVAGAPGPMTASPHDITIDADGVTIWFTGKATATIGKINPDKSVNHYQLPTLGALPIYLNLGPDGNIWGTELQGNKIVRITPTGVVTEFAIPTYNSRPISIFPDPIGRAFMWFTEEAGHKVGKISTTTGVIEEFLVPKTQSNMILASLAFDNTGNLYTQSYVNQNSSIPPGPDYIVKLSRDILFASSGDLSRVQVTNYQVPSRNTVFHRITCGTDGNMYFTELAKDNAGRLLVGNSLAATTSFVFQFGM